MSEVTSSAEDQGGSIAEVTARQDAEQIYNVRGDVNYFLSQYKEETEDELRTRLEQARALLESKKVELYATTKRSGWNSKDAKSLVEDCALYRDQVVAVKQSFAMRGLDLHSHRLDAETLEQAIRRFKQVEKDARRQKAERLEREREREAKAEHARQQGLEQQAEVELVAQQERFEYDRAEQATKERNGRWFGTAAVVLLGLWGAGEIMKAYPMATSLAFFGGLGYWVYRVISKP